MAVSWSETMKKLFLSACYSLLKYNSFVIDFSKQVIEDVHYFYVTEEV